VPRPPSAPDLLVETLQPHVHTALEALAEGRRPGERGHRPTRVRAVCDLLAMREIRPTVPLVRALIGLGSPNDINADIRQWQLDAGKRQPLIDLAGDGLKDIAASLEATLREIIARAREAARRELEPEREALLLARQELTDQARANERVVEDARREAAEHRSRFVALDARLAVESALRASAEQQAAEASVQREALSRRITLAEERLAGLTELKKDNARLQAELSKRATELERLHRRIDELDDVRVQHQIGARELQTARSQLTTAKRANARLSRELSRARQQRTAAKASAAKVRKSRTRTSARRTKRQVRT
jgi:hypothetical protein